MGGEVMGGQDLNLDGFDHLSFGWEHGCGVKKDGKLECWGRNDFNQVVVPEGIIPDERHKWSQVSVGRFHSCALDHQGQGQCWGKSQEGQLSFPPLEEGQSWNQVSAGWNATCALDSQSQAHCWGENEHGQLNLPNHQWKTVHLGHRFGCGIDLEDHLHCWGMNQYGQATPPSGTFKEVYPSKTDFACALGTDNEVICWGNRSHGKTIPPAGQYQSLSTGHDHACGILSTGESVCWGENKNQGNRQETSVPAGDFTSLHAGGRFTCGVRNSGFLRCWGSIHPPQGPLFNDISLGLAHSCGVKVDGSLICWGWPRANRLDPPAGVFDRVAVGWEHACALHRDGGIQCWGVGLNREEFERDGDFDQSISPLPPQLGGQVYVDLVSGAHHSCAIAQDGSVRCWGDNVYGQATPPNESFSRIFAGGWMSCGLTESQNAICWGDQRFGAEFHTALSELTWLDLSIGVDRVCGISTENQSYCWIRPGGDHPLSTLRTGESSSRSMDSSEESVDTNTVLERIELGQGQSIFTGINQSCIIRLDGSSQCFEHTSQTPISTPNDDLVRQWSIGDQTRCMLKSDLTLECTGRLLIE